MALPIIVQYKGELLHTTRRYGTEQITFHPDGKVIATGDTGGALHFWDMDTGEQLQTFTGHKGGKVTGLTFTSDGQTLASSGWDGTVLLWEMETILPETPQLTEDINGDGIVNIQDLVLITNAFGEKHPDLNGDGVVDILDLVIVANALQ